MGSSKSKEEKEAQSKQSKKTSTQVTNTDHGFSQNNTATSFQRTITTQHSYSSSLASTQLQGDVQRSVQSVSPRFASNTISPASNIGSVFQFDNPTWRAGHSGTVSGFPTNSQPSRPAIPSYTPAVRGPLGQYSSPVSRLRTLSTPTLETSRATPRMQYDLDVRPIIDIRIKKKPQLIKEIKGGIPMYNTIGPRRGKSLIINNIKFKTKPRSGAEYDGKNLFNLFKALNLDPKTKNNLKANEMKVCLEGFAKSPGLDKVDMCVIAIMSHGTGTMDAQTEITGIDNETVTIFDIISYFSKDNCPSLYGKPKIFIFQCCRGEDQLVEHDAQPMRPLNCGDMLLAYATMPGFVSYRNVELGSYFIREICNVFMNHACDTHLEDMLKKVGESVKEKLGSKRQLTSYENLSFKNCYFNPV
ncbi:caspase-2-like isoform X1 [Atheta coriaria]|uniref:caspase-2-like isoform X1 n=1 Tax=Dalotia coriaria TaxID=877792 RepID=UPI0031F3E5A9